MKFVLEADAQRRVAMEIPQGVGAQKEVPSDLPRPGLGVDQVAAPARGQRRQLGQDRVDGALEAGLRGRQVGGGGEGPGALQRQDVGVVAVQPRVSLRPRAASKTAWVTWPRSAVAIFWSTSAGVVLRLTAAVKSVVLGRSKSAVAIFWCTSGPDCLAARSRASWSVTVLRA